jgi:hypothetical protein
LRFKPCPIPRQYTLNHYYKYITKQPMKVNDLNTENQTSHVWQLVPDILTLDFDKFDYSHLNRLPKQFNPAWMEYAAWQVCILIYVLLIII